MSSDFTEHQSDDELRNARKLSVEPTRPPAKIEGYAIQSFIGRGSYGEVWSAIDQKTGKRVAIKFYAQRSSHDVKQLAQEVEKLVVLAADRHVVQLLDVGWDASPPYYVMDYIESGSLEDRIKSGAAMPVSRAVEVFREVATGLMHLHGKGVLHCDLKPGNVLLDPDGKPRLADFGQSRLETDSTSALGTLFYMAPEQADLRSIPDAKWDVYGLGALLFTMLTGKPPYYSEELKRKIENAETLNDRLKIYRQGLGSAKRLKEHRSIPGVDRTLADIIDRCIAPRPSDRFPSAQSVLVALQQRDLKQQSRPLMLLGVLGPVLLLTLMSLFGWWAVRQATDDADKAIIAKAGASNEFAARLAARSAAEQLNEYFRVVQQAAKSAELVDSFEELVADEQLASLRKQLSDPNANGSEDNAKARLALVAHPARRRLQTLLQRLLDDNDNELPDAASWFANDRSGNQVCAVFEDGKRTDTIGQNWSYRTYFTGFPEDLTNKESPRKHSVEEDGPSRPIIDQPHLSASFPSKATGMQKVAFSTPVRNKAGEVIGIVAATVNLGNLVDFQDSHAHYVMLVDDRKDAKGDNSGIILEHPLFLRARRLDPQQKLPAELTAVRADLREYENEGTEEDSEAETIVGMDPLGATSIGKTYEYDRKFIVASIEVGEESQEPTDVKVDEAVTATGTKGIHVIAFEDYESVLAPSKNLSDRLGRLALLALAILLSVAIGMWLLVQRLFRQSRRGLASTPGGSGTIGSFGGSSLPSTASSQTGPTARLSENTKKG